MGLWSDLQSFYRGFKTYQQDKAAPGSESKPPRGYQIVYTNQLMSTTGMNQAGQMVNGQFEYPWFTLMPNERVELCKKTSTIFGIISSRMNQISSQGFRVTRDTSLFEREVQDMKSIKSIYDEYANYTDPKYNIAAVMLGRELQKKLPELLPDLSNFDKCIIRLNRMAYRRNRMSAEAVEAWLEKPNRKEDFEDVVKKYVWSLLVHGAADIYKKWVGNDLESFHSLPGGGIFQVINETVDNNAPEYVQMIWGKTPLFYTDREILHDIYLPVGDNFFGLIPIEALLNKIIEQLLSDKYWAEQADGTRPVEKLIAVEGGPNGYNLLRDGKPVSMSPEEKERLAEAVADSKKNAIDVITATGNISVLDISRENMGPFQLERIKEAKLDMARVFNMSNMEINNTGGEGTSGRVTADQQREIEKEKGTYPILLSIQKKFQAEIVDAKFGPGYMFSTISGFDESEILEKADKKFKTGLFAANRILVDDLNEEPYDDPQYDYPPGAQGLSEALNNTIQESMNKWQKKLPSHQG